MIEEIWKDIPSYPGYQASSLGRTRIPKGIQFNKKSILIP